MNRKLTMDEYLNMNRDKPGIPFVARREPCSCNQDFTELRAENAKLRELLKLLDDKLLFMWNSGGTQHLDLTWEMIEKIEEALK